MLHLYIGFKILLAIHSTQLKVILKMFIYKTQSLTIYNILGSTSFHMFKGDFFLSACSWVLYWILYEVV